MLRWFVPWPRLDLLLCGTQNNGQQLVAAVALFGGEGDQAHVIRQGQHLADAGKI